MYVQLLALLFICSFLECTVRTHCTPSSSNKSIHIPMTRGGRGAHLYVSHDMLSGSMDLTDDIDGLSPSLKYRFYRHVPEAEGDAYSQDASVLAICIPLGVIASSIRRLSYNDCCIFMSLLHTPSRLQVIHRGHAYWPSLHVMR